MQQIDEGEQTNEGEEGWKAQDPLEEKAFECGDVHLFKSLHPSDISFTF